MLLDARKYRRRKPKKIEGLEIDEVSIVDVPANQIPFALIKRAKAKWTRAYINDLPDSAFLYIEPGGKKDEEGKTVPRSLRHFPYKDKNGKVDLPHLRNAIARIPQSKLPEKLKERLQAKARRILEREQGKKKVKQADSLSVRFQSNWTVEGSELVLNGETIPLNKLESFAFGYTKLQEGAAVQTSPFYLSYTLQQEEGGPSVTYTFQKAKKGASMIEPLKKITKELFGEEVPELAEGLSEEQQQELVKNLQVIADYSAYFPTELASAVGAVILTKADGPIARVAEILREAAEKLEELDEGSEETKDSETDEEEEEQEEETEEEETEEESSAEEEEEEEASGGEDDEEEEEGSEQPEEDNEDSEEDSEIEIPEDELEQLAADTAQEVLAELLGD